MGVSKFVIFILTGLSQITWSYQQASNLSVEKQRILDQLLQNYDTGIRPSGVNGTDGPVTIKVDIRLKKIISFSDYDMDFGILIMLHQEWVDERLKYEDKGNLKYLPLSDPAKIWTPGIFFPNEKDSHLHKLMSPNHFVEIHPTGRILYSARVSLTLWCHMQLEKFPFDTQVCSIHMSPYGYTAAEVVVVWRETDAVQIPSYSNIVGFTLEQVLTSSSLCQTYMEEYSCLQADMYFQRDLQYYVLHTFVPSTVLVVVSWASFWMDRRAVVARILIVLSTLFAMSSLTTDIEASVPHVPYIKAMDLWFGACFTFLLAALVEFAVVNATGPDDGELIRNEVKNKDGSTTVDMKPLVRKSTDSTQAPIKPNSESTDLPFYQRLLQRLPRNPSRIDTTARMLFPSAFFVFFILYFLVYSIQ